MLAKENFSVFTEEELDKCFFSVNKGLERRFTYRFTIESYDVSGLRDILFKFIKLIQY